MEKLYNKALDGYSNLILVALIAVLFLFTYNIKEFQLDASSDTLILEQDKDLKKYREIIEDYGSSDFLIVTFTDENKILEEENLYQIKNFIEKINKLQWVQSTQSIFDVPLLEVNSQTLSDLVNEVLTIESTSVDLADAEKELLESPIFKNLIISEDASSTAILIYFKKNVQYEFLLKERDKINNQQSNYDINYINEINTKYKESKKQFDNDRHDQINELREIIKQKKNNSNLIMHLGGVSMIADDTISFVKNDIIIFGIGAFIFILIVLFLVFKNPIWMLACITNCSASLIIMIGTVSMLGWKVTVISSNFIMLMLILSLSMTVHIVVRHKQYIFEYKDLTNTQKIVHTIKNMYKPCLFAALTSIFAFATLYTSGIKPVMDFGLMMCVGLSITYVTSFIFLPFLINFLNLDETSKPIKYEKNSLFLYICTNFPNSVIFIFTLTLCLGIYGATKLEVENSFVDYFKKDTEIYKGMKLIDDKLGGTTPLDIIIEFNVDKENLFEKDESDDFLDFGIEYDPADYWFTKEKIDTIKRVHDHLEMYPFAGKVLSLASIVRTAEKLNSDREFDTLELSVLYKNLPKDLKEQIISPYVLIDKNQARISMRVIDTHSELRRSEFINDLNKYIENNLSTETTEISLAGILILYNNMLESLFDSQIKSLAIVLSGIFIMLILLFRSIKIAVATIIPNIIACFAILGLMGFMKISLDLMTITIAAITIGIAVDNCIHYVYRYIEHYKETENHYETLEVCNNSVGIAIRNTSYTIIAGFSILVLSNFFPTIYFGLFTALAMFIALLGSLTLLPVLLKMMYKF